MPERAAQETPGAILGEGEGLDLTDGDRERVRGVLGVIRNAKEHLWASEDEDPSNVIPLRAAVGEPMGSLGSGKRRRRKSTSG